MNAVDGSAIGDLSETGFSAVYVRVGVGGCLAQTRHSRVPIRPGGDQKSRGHGATQTDTTPSFGAVQRHHQLTDKVRPYGLREGQTEAEPGSLIAPSLKVDPGCRVTVH